MKDIFYDFTGSFGHKIVVKYCSGLQMMRVQQEAKDDQGKFIELLILKCVTINGKAADTVELDKISASDYLQLQDAIGKQISNLKLL